MPASKRDKMKRQLGLAFSCLERATEHLASVHSEFQKWHPLHAQLLELTSQAVFVASGWIKDFWEKTWGPMPNDVRRWRDRQKKEP